MPSPKQKAVQNSSPKAAGGLTAKASNASSRTAAAALQKAGAATPQKAANTASAKAGAGSSGFLGASFKQPKSAEAYFHVVPAPFVGERFRSSAMAQGPDAILQASQGLEPWDGRSIPARHGIYTHGSVDCKGSTEKVLEKVASLVSDIVSQGKFPVGLGGDGMVTYGIVKGFLEAGIEDFGVIQIDAQADLRDDDNGNQWSEACVMKRIVDEDVPLFQLGVRSLSKEETDARKVYGVKFYDADFLVSRNVTKVEMPSEFPEKVFVSIDIDGFDPSVFPSPGSVPGGLGWVQVLSLIESISQQADIIGFDLSEFTPVPGQPYYDNAAALLIYKIMGIVERARL